MPHFVIDCSENIVAAQNADAVCEIVHQAASSTALFSDNNIQVRLNAFSSYRVGNQKVDFIQVFAHILEGRTAEQKSQLSTMVVTKLTEMFPDLATIGVDIIDLEKGTACNRTML